MNYRDRIGSQYDDLDIIRLDKEYLVRIEALSGKYYRVSSMEEVKGLILKVKNLTGKTLYVGFGGAKFPKDNMLLESERREFELYIKEILWERNKQKRANTR